MPATKTLVSFAQYQALQRPVVLPTPQELFDFEVETLVKKGLATYDMADPFRKDQPIGLFLLIPPQAISLAEAMSLIVVAGKEGRNFLSAADLTDEVEVPQGPYLMCEVEDGDSRRNIRPSVNRQNILSEGRSPYLTWEGIVHGVVFPEVLAHHAMDPVGSRCKSGYWPHLYLDDGRPKLDANLSDNAYPEWGVPSCGRRIAS